MFIPFFTSTSPRLPRAAGTRFRCFASRSMTKKCKDELLGDRHKTFFSNPLFLSSSFISCRLNDNILFSVRFSLNTRVIKTLDDRNRAKKSRSFSRPLYFPFDSLSLSNCTHAGMSRTRTQYTSKAYTEYTGERRTRLASMNRERARSTAAT